MVVPFVGVRKEIVIMGVIKLWYVKLEIFYSQFVVFFIISIWMHNSNMGFNRHSSGLQVHYLGQCWGGGLCDHGGLGNLF